MTKEDFIYVGIDLHKETHTAVVIDCYNNKLTGRDYFRQQTSRFF